MDASRVQPIKLARVRKQLRLTNKSFAVVYTATVMCIVLNSPVFEKLFLRFCPLKRFRSRSFHGRAAAMMPATLC